MKKKPQASANKGAGTYLNSSNHVHVRLSEGCLLLAIAVSVFLSISLFSYHLKDPAWSHVTSQNIVVNSGGRAGAMIADIMLYACGYLAYFFPLMVCYAAWIFFVHRKHKPELNMYKWVLVFLRTIGFLLIFVAGCGLTNIYIIIPMTELPYNAGGVLGTVVAMGMLQAFNKIGATLILVTLFLVGVTLFTGLSWIRVLRCMAVSLLWLYKKSMSGFFWAKQKLFTLIKSRQANKIVPRMYVQQKEANQILPTAMPAKNVIKKLKIIQQKWVSDPINRKEKLSESLESPTVRIQKQVMPKLSLLDAASSNQQTQVDEDYIAQQSIEVELRLADFNIQAKVVAVHPGPVVTRYELQLAAGTKVSKVTALVKDLARSLSVISVRIVEVIPGKSVIGLEIPNVNREMVTLQAILASQQYRNARSALTLALGKDIAGNPVIVDLAKMPHLLVAGTTGSGKSVNLNAMLLSLLYKSSPKQLRMILIDPKMLELSLYEGIPHLLTPVVTDMKDAARALRWCVVEMERRYRLMAALGVRNLAGFNVKIYEAKKRGQRIEDPQHPEGENGAPRYLEPLAQIVVIADEFADMMVVVGKKVETLIARLAQKARAAGVHLVFATQRPSVDVITGLIKANIPTRIAFQVSSKIDSRTILDQQGAEQLLGHGDMLYLPPGSGVPVRVHGAYVSDDEVHRVVKYLKQQGVPEYMDEILEEKNAMNSLGDLSQKSSSAFEDDSEKDELYDQAVEVVVRSRRVSISSIQRRFKIGYNRAARIVEAMEVAGIISPMETNGSREVLVPPPQQ